MDLFIPNWTVGLDYKVVSTRQYHMLRVAYVPNQLRAEFDSQLISYFAKFH